MSENLNKDFGRLKAGYLPAVKRSKTHGNLLLDGRAVETNKPFALLQWIKTTQYSHITPKKRLKIERIKI